MFECWKKWREPHDMSQAREAARAAAEEQARLRALTTYIAAERRTNHFAERFSAALDVPLK